MVDVDTTTDVPVLTDDAPAEEVWNVLVDVTTTVETDVDEGETVVTELALDVSADAESEEDVPPVLNATLWRFSIAIAMSTPVAETEEMAKIARSVMASERMLTVGFVSLPRVDENGGRRRPIGEGRSSCLQKRA
jgi:hypothetical protein